jgi:hypothetical protein
MYVEGGIYPQRRKANSPHAGFAIGDWSDG